MFAERTSLVTGGAGFIGSHLVDKLLELGGRVIALDNLVLGKRTNLDRALSSPGFAFAELDVNNIEGCVSFLRSHAPGGAIDTVWHMAANSDIQAGGREPDVDLKLTFMSTYNVLKLMQELKIPRLVFASSSAIYGEHEGALREETGPLLPISNYGAMKLASEGIISAAVERFLKQAWICRFPNVVGGRATHGIIHDFLKKLAASPGRLEVLGDGTQEKPYLHVSELVEAMVYIVQHSEERLNVFNIAPTAGATTVKYIAEAVLRETGSEARIEYTGGSRGWVGDVPRFSYSTEKLQKLGWRPGLASNEAIDQAIRDNLPDSKR